MASSASCVFCKIIKGEIPSFKLYETAKSYAFLDISPTATGHALVIPKYHGAKLHNIPDDYLADILPVAKKIAMASDVAIDQSDETDLSGPGYNILQNNGAIAHQVVPHVHFHFIPKRNEETGLVVGWPQPASDMDKLKALHAELVEKISKL